MSVRFQDAAALEARYVGSTPKPGGLPISVTCWVYFGDDDRPGVGDTWTLWWFGQVGAAGDNFIALLAERGTGQGVKLTAFGKLGANTLAATIDDVPIGEGFPAGAGWHCVSVVLTDATLTRRLTLYVDDRPPEDDSGPMAIGVTTWDRFAAGRSYTANPQGLERFSIEQVAIWEGALGSGDTARMYDERIPPKDAAVAGLGINRAPDFSYWYLAPHARGGIPATNDDAFDGQLNGGIFNVVSTDLVPRPLLGWDAAMDGTPRWSARTPVFRYTVAQPIEPIARPAFVEPSRLQPHFFIVNGPQTGPNSRCRTPGYSNAEVRTMSYFRDPNMSYMSKVDFFEANALEPPYTEADLVPTPYLPQKDLALVAKRMADWFALQSFTAGRGVGPGRRYAGGLQMRGPGDGGLRGGALLGLLGMAPSTGGVSFPGTPDGIPLVQNYADRVTPNSGVQEPWQTWYRASGHAALKPWMDHFWAALKQELDDRGLCYPLRIHLDYEGWVRPGSQLRRGTSEVASNAIQQVGAWPATAADARKNTEVLFTDRDPATGAQRSRTLQQVLTDDPPPAYDPEHDFYEAENQAFAQWWWRYAYACRAWAVYEALLATVKDYFPATLIGDYAKYACDHPGYPDVEQAPPRAFNSAGNASFPLDFGTPVLYSNGAWADNVRGGYDGRVGYTISESVRDVATMNIDAVANARVKARVSPTFEDATRELGWGARRDQSACAVTERWQYVYELTGEDQREVMEHAWRRGVTDFILFSFRQWYGEGNVGMFEAKLDVCRGLRDGVHACVQYDQARTGRTARVGWRSM